MSTRTLILFGASGDLAERLLLPGLATVLARGAGPDVRLIGTGRSEIDAEEWRSRVSDAFDSVDASGERVGATLDSTRYLAGDPTEAGHLRDLLDAAQGEPVLYFGLPPGVVRSILDALGDVDLPAGTTLAFDKPFGTDAASARDLNEAASALVPAEHIHRTDHFLGERVVLTLLALRRGGALLDRLLTREHVERVDVVWDETLALEGRAGYYDSAGALVDMVQSHLLHVVAALAADPQTTDPWTPTTLHEALADVLEHTSLADGDPTRTTLRARYTAGEVDGARVPAYLDEDDVDPDNATETLAEVELAVDTPRWAGVPFRVRSGKALGADHQEVIVTLRGDARLLLTFDPPAIRLELGTGGTDPGQSAGATDSGHSAGATDSSDSAGAGSTADESANGATTRADGTEGSPLALLPVDLAADLPEDPLTPYGEVLADLLEDRRLLSVRDDVAARCWEIVQPVLDAWQADAVPMQDYPAGSDGATRP